MFCTVVALTVHKLWKYCNCGTHDTMKQLGPQTLFETVGTTNSVWATQEYEEAVWWPGFSEVLQKYSQKNIYNCTYIYPAPAHLVISIRIGLTPPPPLPPHPSPLPPHVAYTVYTIQVLVIGSAVVGMRKIGTYTSLFLFSASRLLSKKESSLPNLFLFLNFF